jgi:hypothetical protein
VANFSRIYRILLLIFLKKRWYVSKSIMDESVMDLYVSQTPIGRRMAEESHIPITGLRALSRANCSPDMDKTYQARKNRTEITVGIPSPPFLIMAPSGAPIKKNIRQANDSVNFRWVSIWYLLRRETFASVLDLDVEI